MVLENKFKSVNTKYIFRDRLIRLEVVVLFIVVLLVIALFLFKIRPQDDEYTDVLQRNSVIEGMISEKRKLNSIAIEYEKTAPVIDVVEEKLSSKFSQAELTRKLNAIARENGVEILTMNTKNGEAKSGYQSYVNEIAFKAAYPSIKKLISSFESLPGFNTIVEFSLSKETNKGSVNGTLLLVTAKEAR